MIGKTGYFRCLPLLPAQEILVLPPENNPNYLGAIAVGFSEQLDGAELLGFIPSSTSKKEIKITELENINLLLEQF